MKAALYCRVSTFEQTTEDQRLELTRYCEARGWNATEYLGEGVSGSKESRPALDRLLTDARRRRFDTLVVWKLDRLGRNLRHLILDGTYLQNEQIVACPSQPDCHPRRWRSLREHNAD